MKLKQLPEDFRVEELTDVQPSDGPFALYRLTKRGWTTVDALAAVRRRWQIDQRRLSYGGLKDRHALTVQYFTILHGPRRRLTHHGIAVEYLGQVPEPFRSEHIRANRFDITLRGLSEENVAAAVQALREVSEDGMPNYFDDQRFGSVTAGGEFVAKKIIRGEYEEALRLALTAPYEHDRAAQKQEKAILRECWGDWEKCRQRLPRGHARSLVDYLMHHPGDFRGAVERLRPELRGLYLSAYQSHLWNRMLARWLRENLRPERWLSLRLKLGDYPVPQGLGEADRACLHSLSLPLPSPRQPVADDPRWALVEAVLEEEGITLEQMKLKKLRTMFFSRGERPAWYWPAGMSYNSGEDDLNHGRRILRLHFELPRGSYATLIVKRITQGRSP